jgi:hypothetical protein
MNEVTNKDQQNKKVIAQFQKQRFVKQAITILESDVVTTYVNYDMVMKNLCQSIEYFSFLHTSKSLKVKSHTRISDIFISILDSLNAHEFTQEKSYITWKHEYKSLLHREIFSDIDDIVEIIMEDIRELFIKAYKKDNKTKSSLLTVEEHIENPLLTLKLIFNNLKLEIFYTIDKSLWNIWNDLVYVKSPQNTLFEMFLAFMNDSIFFGVNYEHVNYNKVSEEEMGKDVYEFNMLNNLTAFNTVFKAYYALSVFLWCRYTYHVKKKKYFLLEDDEYENRKSFLLLYNQFIHYDKYIANNPETLKILQEHPDKVLYKLDFEESGMVIRCIYDGIDGDNGNGDTHGLMSKREKKKLVKVHKEKHLVLKKQYYTDITRFAIIMEGIVYEYPTHSLGLKISKEYQAYCYQCLAKSDNFLYMEGVIPYNHFCSIDCQKEWRK